MEINKILAIGKHTLHFYTADINKYAIQIPFLAQGNGKKIYVTNDKEDAAKELKDMKVSIVKPEEFKIEKNARIVVDATSSSFLEFEEKLQNLKCVVLCTYDLTKINPSLLKRIVQLHDKLIITNSSSTLISGKEEKPDEKAIEKFVKRELPTITLALILNKPMCGHDIMKVLHRNFNVLISPGSLYPLLKDLEKKGLLKCEYKIKNKIYQVNEKEAVKNMLAKQVQANHFISKFIEKNT